MTKLTVRLRSLDDLRQFVDMASLCDYPVNAETEEGLVDAKSLIGMFTAGLQKPIVIRADASEAECEPFRKSLGSICIDT